MTYKETVRNGETVENFIATVEASPEPFWYDKNPYDDGVKFDDRPMGGGPISALRAYRAYHPAARIYDVTHRGRTVWMTLKQFAIWRECQKYYKRGKRTTLAEIAKTVGCSRATVSRFLVRLDLWRFIDYVAIVGRAGFIQIQTRRDVFTEWDANSSGARHTIASRKKARNLLALAVKRRMRQALNWMLFDGYSPSAFHDTPLAFYIPAQLGRTVATFSGFLSNFTLDSDNIM